MRTQPFTSRLSALMFAPLLMVACGQDNAGGSGEFVTLPLCSGDNQVLSTNKDGQLICKDLPPGATALPDCKKYSEALTADGTKVFCTNRNNETPESKAALDKLEESEKLIIQYQMELIGKGGGPTGPAPRATYCGQYSAAQNPNGAISDAGVTGVFAAATLCRKVAGCNPNTAKMCTVYDMYHSVATGVVTAAMNIGQSWVHMSAWQHNGIAGQATPNNGLNDNCGGWTYPTGDLKWYGTTVEWKAAQTGPKALHFASGPGVVGCAQRFPIACCN